MDKWLKQRVTISVSVLVVVLLLLFIINGINTTNPLNSLSIGLTDQYVELERGTTNTPYTCPTNANGGCLVNGIMDCDVLKGSANYVTFRGNSDYNRVGYPVAFAIPTSTKLNSYTHYSEQISNTICNNKPLYVVTNPTAEIHWYNNQLVVCHDNTARIYVLGGNASTSTILLSGEDCNQGKIRCSGELSSYSCSGKLVDLNNNVIAEKLYTSFSNEGKNLKTPQKDISAGTTVKMTGGDTNKVEYVAYKIIQSCSANYCQGDTGYIQCVNNLIGGFVPCTGILKCSNGKCVPPISSIDITIKDSQGKEKIGFGIGEPINILINVVSDFPMNVNISLRESSPSGNMIWSESRKIQSGVQNKFTTSLTELKKYYVLMEIDMGLTEKYYYGDDSNEEKYIRIAPSISNSVNIRSPTQSRLFVNNPVWVEVNVYDANGAAEPDKIMLNIKYKNVPITNIPDYKKPPIVSGGTITYTYVFTFLTPGQLEVTSTVERAGIVSAPSSFSSKVEDIKIITDFTNIDEFRCVPISSQTLKFESKNSFGDYVDTTNSLSVVEPDTTIPKGISSTIIRKDTGKYEVTYSFTKKGATTFKLESFSVDYNLGSAPRSGVIEVRDGCVPDECTQTSDCPTGNTCVNGKCEGGTLWGMYLAIIGGIIFFIVLIVLVINLIKRKKVSFGES